MEAIKLTHRTVSCVSAPTIDRRRSADDTKSAAAIARHKSRGGGGIFFIAEVKDPLPHRLKYPWTFRRRYLIYGGRFIEGPGLDGSGFDNTDFDGPEPFRRRGFDLRGYIGDPGYDSPGFEGIPERGPWQQRLH